MSDIVRVPTKDKDGAYVSIDKAMSELLDDYDEITVLSFDVTTSDLVLVCTVIECPFFDLI